MSAFGGMTHNGGSSGPGIHGPKTENVEVRAGDLSHETQLGLRAFLRSRILVAVALPVVLFLLIQPEAVGLTPSSLDPFFYTGYAINFDDMLREVGARIYFISRWPAYLPARGFSELFGPWWGRLVLRWLVATAMLLSLWWCGRRWDWNRATEIVAGVVVLSSPIFVRAYFTDYVEWLIVSVGFASLALAVAPRVTVARSAMLGVFGAAMVICNPIASSVAGIVAVCHALNVRREGTQLWWHIASYLGAACVTAAFGWVVFRYAYDVPNVYEPTVDFLLNNPGLRDARKAPDASWLGAFTWIYVPALVLAAFVLVRPLRDRIVRSDDLRIAAGVLLAQYVVQWIDQFGRDGTGLEISYYWSFCFPALGFAVAALCGAIQWNPRSAVGFLAAWSVALAWPNLQLPDIPGGLWLVVLAVLTISAVAALGSRVPGAAVGLVLVAGVLAQTAAPQYGAAPIVRHQLDPRYDRVLFRFGTTESERDFKTAAWMEDQLDQLESDTGLFFIGGGRALAIIGIYGPHVTGHWITTDASWRVDPAGLQSVTTGERSSIVVLGPADFVAVVRDQLLEAAPAAAVVMERFEPSGNQFKLLVIDTI